MFALILWFTFGWRACAIELLVELAIGLTLFGGGGKRIRRSLYDFAETKLRVMRPTPEPTWP
jgi:hypothetical protein